MKESPPPSAPFGINEPSVFQSLFTANPDALLLVDADGLIVLANPAAASLLGYPNDTLVGLSIEALVPDSLRPRHAAHRQAYARDPRTRPMGEYIDLTARRRDGNEIVVEIALSPLRNNSQPYVVAAIRAVGEYPRVKQALKRARYGEQIAQIGRLVLDTRNHAALVHKVPTLAAAALQAEACLIYMLEPDQRAFRVVAGHSSLEIEPLGSLWPNSSGTPWEYMFSRRQAFIVANDRSEQRFKVPQICVDAGLHSSATAPIIDSGRVTGMLVARSRQTHHFGEDELRFLESLANLLAAGEQREQAEESLNHAQRMEAVGQLTGGIAHDFNNLLAIIQGNLQILEEMPAISGDTYGSQLVGAAQHAGERAAELTAKLLAFSRRQVLKPSQVDVAVMLESLVDMLRRTLDKRIQLRLDTPEACPACLVDAMQLETALLNIAINARDAMPDGGVLSFTCRPCDALPEPLQTSFPADSALDSGYLMITVSDSGCGMSEAVKEHAFEPFFTTKEVGRGTGLGLSTVYGFARQSSGAVSLDSTPGSGTTVTLYLPCFCERRSVERVSGHVAGAHVPPKLKVLLVDDEPEVINVTRTFLAALGCRVTACANAEQALQKLDAGADCELLLTDVMLGAGMPGTELARLVQERFPQLAILLMSGFSSEFAEPDQAGIAPRWNLLHKPYTREDLARAISKAIAARR